ncbi:MAG: hypothetical protein ACE5EX_06410 [Phycisphaerae bacterium]
MPNEIPDLIGNEFFSIDLHGYNRVRNNLRRAAADMPHIAEREALKWARETRLILRSTRYPPKRRGQTYRRTGRLANSWRAAHLPTGATILNTAHRRGRFYSRYVVGNARGAGQAWFHKTFGDRSSVPRHGRSKRWWKARDVVDEEVPRFARALTKALVAELTKGAKGAK